MKKILITAYNLDIGGIETALLNLLKKLDLNKYDITLVLEKKEGIFLDQVPSGIKVIDYNLSYSKNIIYRKLRNRLKLIIWKLTHKNKYDYSFCFATHSIPGAHIALNGSKNNVIWIHSNYCSFFKYDMDKLNNFFNKIKLSKFKNYIFVSYQNKDETLKYYNLEGNIYVINNIMDGESIIKKSKQKIEYQKPKDKILFVNVSRHDEYQKRITRIIEASNKLLKEGYDFELLLIGDGPEHQLYQDLVKKYKLEKNIKFLGKKSNPFPYYKIADAAILSSPNEGYPVVFNEARILNVPLITTKVSDYQDIENKYGIVTEQEEIYIGMKQFLDKGFKIKKEFNYKEYNQDILNKIENLINNN